MPATNNNSNAADDDGKDGIFDRLAKNLFANSNSPFTEFADRQRIERLEQCQELQRIVEACQAAAANTNNVDSHDTGNNDNTKNDTSRTIGISEIPTSRSGTRIARFFKWDTSDMSEGETDVPQEQTDASSSASDVFNEAASSFTTDVNENSQPTIQSNKTNARTSFSKGCTIETHELWACKALAVGCGNHLQDLRRCWSNQRSLAAGNNGGMTYYKSDEEKSCSNIQVDMARCINKHTAELNERSNNAAKNQ